jgi:hypothetical protein
MISSFSESNQCTNNGYGKLGMKGFIRHDKLWIIKPCMTAADRIPRKTYN